MTYNNLETFLFIFHYIFTKKYNLPQNYYNTLKLQKLFLKQNQVKFGVSVFHGKQVFHKVKFKRILEEKCEKLNKIIKNLEKLLTT